MLQSYLVWLALFLLVTILIGLLRVVHGPTPADRMLGIQLFGTTAVAILLLLSRALDDEALTNVALVFTLLSLLVLIAFIARVPPGNVERPSRR